ncbi:MAG: hypothetical protein JOY71_04910 [Acetobacteraceae bacterium]|nr:hypothetical protein [Acetobacteraceae bacterium]MBV8521461.1 hypothetical protein [Acetobacteraceae bacterium]
MKTAEGTVLLVQESRMKVQLDSGASQLFIISHKSPAEPQELQHLQKAQAKVRITYEEGDRGMYAVARRIMEI